MNPKPLDDSRYLDIEKAAAYTSFSVDALYRRVSDQTIPFIKIGRSLRFDRIALDAWMETQKTAPISDPDLLPEGLE